MIILNYLKFTFLAICTHLYNIHIYTMYIFVRLVPLEQFSNT